MAGGGVGADDQEEVGEAVHGGAEVGLGSAAGVPDVVYGAAVTAGDVEWVEPVAGLVAVGEHEDVTWDGAFGGGDFAVGFAEGRIVTAGSESDAVFLDRGQREGCEFDLWIVEAVEPICAGHATFAADLIVRREQLQYFSGTSRCM